MAHDVFISYSSKDKPVADAVCHGLEASGISCWIAPRDLLAGEDWNVGIVHGIRTAKAMILILSSHSNISKQVHAEVGCAFDEEKIIIPFRIEDVALSDELAYPLRRKHWMDALTPPLQDHIASLVLTMKALLPSSRVAPLTDIPIASRPDAVTQLPPAPTPESVPVSSSVSNASPLQNYVESLMRTVKALMSQPTQPSGTTRPPDQNFNGVTAGRTSDDVLGTRIEITQGDLTPLEKQAAADAALVAVWVMPDGTWHNSKAETMTAHAVQKALYAGADVDARDKRGWTALIVAGWAGYTDVARLLIEHGADVNAKNRSGETALSWAATYDHADVANLLIERGADVNARENDGETALMSAAYSARVNIIKLLLDQGADVNMKKDNGETALMKAADHRNQKSAKILIEHGADVNATDDNGWTALMYASVGGWAYTAQSLIHHGADVDATDDLGYTALHYAENPRQYVSDDDKASTIKVLKDAASR